MLFMFRKHHLYLSILIILDYFLFPSWSTWYLDMEYMVFEYYLDITFILWHCIMLHCIAFGVMSQTYGCDCTDTALVYWAWRYRLSIPCWIWRQEFICIRMHTSLVWHRDAASYFVGYEGRSSSASICIRR